MRSEEQVARMLRLVPYLSAHPVATTAEVAEAFGITPGQVIKDLEVLQFCGLPGHYPDDLFEVDIDAARETGVIHFGNAEVLARPLRLRHHEATSLLAALTLVVELAGQSDAAASALAKLSSAIGEASPAVTVDLPETDQAVRAGLNTAIAERRVIELSYRTPGRSSLSTILAEPAQVRLISGFAYLDAWSRTRQAWRSFRLDRIAGVRLTEETCQEHGQPPQHWFDDAPRSLSLTVTRQARWITEYYPATEITDDGDSLTVTFPVGSLDWAVRLVLRLGAQVISIREPEIAEAAKARAAEALKLYGVHVG